MMYSFCKHHILINILGFMVIDLFINTFRYLYQLIEVFHPRILKFFKKY